MCQGTAFSPVPLVKNRTKDQIKFDTFDGAKPRFLNRGKKRRSVSTLSIPRASDRGVEWVDFYIPFSSLIQYLPLMSEAFKIHMG